MSKTLLKPIETGGKMIPWLDYRIMQHEACIVDYFDEADAEMERASHAIDERQFGIANDHARKAWHKLKTMLETSKVHKEMKWVQQHPKFNNQRKETNQ
jgi:hypothetical protein